eukprot:c39116_g1_i1 orf=98-259(+)
MLTPNSILCGTEILLSFYEIRAKMSPKCGRECVIHRLFDGVYIVAGPLVALEM